MTLPRAGVLLVRQRELEQDARDDEQRGQATRGDADDLNEVHAHPAVSFGGKRLLHAPLLEYSA